MDWYNVFFGEEQLTEDELIDMFSDEYDEEE